MSDLFKFEISATIKVEAKDICEAVKLLKEKHPEISDDNIRQMYRQGRKIPYTLSKNTGERIYFVPGCTCGQTDCIYDPMRKIARNCSIQSDMEGVKWDECCKPDPGQDCCRDYNSWEKD